MSGLLTTKSQHSRLTVATYITIDITRVSSRAGRWLGWRSRDYTLGQKAPCCAPPRPWVTGSKPCGCVLNACVLVMNGKYVHLQSGTTILGPHCRPPLRPKALQVIAKGYSYSRRRFGKSYEQSVKAVIVVNSLSVSLCRVHSLCPYAQAKTVHSHLCSILTSVRMITVCS